MATRDGSDLCLECGLCCTGVVFAGVRLNPDEVTWAYRKKLPVVQIPGGHVFRHPCDLQDGTSCTAYSSRPQHCRDFRCKTLVAYENDAVELEAAQEQMLQIAELKFAIEDRLPETQDEGYFWNFMALLADPRVPEEEKTQIAAMFPDVIDDAKRLRAMVEEHIFVPV